MKAKETYIFSPSWCSGGTGLTNFDQDELDFYISVIEGFGDENFVISKLPMSDYSKYNHLYSLHCLDVRQRKSCSSFWDYFWKVEKDVQHFSKKWQTAKKIQNSSTKAFDNLLNLSTITMCNMHNQQTNKTTNIEKHTMKKLDPSLAKLLSADADKIQAPALKAAAEKFRKQQQEKDEDNALRALKHLQLQTDAHVSAIREIRKREKSMIETLRGITAAKNQFMKDGDVEALNKALVSLRVTQVYM